MNEINANALVVRYNSLKGKYREGSPMSSFVSGTVCACVLWHIQLRNYLMSRRKQ